MPYFCKSFFFTEAGHESQTLVFKLIVLLICSVQLAKYGMVIIKNLKVAIGL
jgi:hypothetical protein